MSTATVTPSDDMTAPASDDPKAAAMEHSMREQGVQPYERRKVDYFGAAGTYQITLPNSDDHVTVKEFREGTRREYMKLINRDIRVLKGVGDALMKGPAGEERVALLTVALTGWDFEGPNGKPVPFDARTLKQFLDTAPPAVIDHIDSEIRKKEPWLTGEPTVEEIDAEIESLQELRQQVIDREEGKASS